MFELTEEQARAKAVELGKLARSVLEQHGWTQGNFGEPGVGFCTLGAIRQAREETKRLGMTVDAWLDARGVLLNAIYNVLPLDEWSGSLIDWNDAKGRTKDEVFDLFDRAVARIEAAQQEAAR
jgi:hypothetical protein